MRDSTSKHHVEKPCFPAEQLPVLRKTPGLSQAEYARAIDVSGTTLSSTEAGARDMRRPVYPARIAILPHDEQTRYYLQHLKVIVPEEHI